MHSGTNLKKIQIIIECEIQQQYTKIHIY